VYALENLYLINDQILDYIKENNEIILRNFGDSCFLLQRKWSGSTIGPIEIDTYDDSSHTVFTLWEGGQNPPNSDHPDVRIHINDGSGAITVEKDGSVLTRVYDEDSLSSSDEFAVATTADGTVKVYLYESGTTVRVTYSTICYCVDPERSQPVSDCSVCYGTGFEGGFDVKGVDPTIINPVQFSCGFRLTSQTNEEKMYEDLLRKKKEKRGRSERRK